jgi:hypothetical protein
VMRAKRSDPLSTIFLLLDSLVVDAIIRRPVMLDGFAWIYIYIFFFSSCFGCLVGLFGLGWVGLNVFRLGWSGLVWAGLNEEIFFLYWAF